MCEDTPSLCDGLGAHSASVQVPARHPATVLSPAGLVLRFVSDEVSLC